MTRARGRYVARARRRALGARGEMLSDAGCFCCFVRRRQLFIACQRGHVRVVALLLEDLRGGGRFREAVNAADADGATPLFAACQNGHVEVARVLCAVGVGRGVGFVEVDKANLEGATPVR